MNADLEHLIALQKLDTAADAARRTLADEPEHNKTLDTRLDVAKAHVAEAKEQLAANQTARRSIEKDVALHQGRLSKFRETAMAVKTNVEYHAVQKEIAFAQTEIKTLEDQELELMVAADELTATVKKAEQALAAEQKAIDADRKATLAQHGELQTSLDRMIAERATLVAGIAKSAVALFEMVARKRNGIAVAEARDGICTICHVRLRPQVFNTVRRNDAITQCDSCNRILFFVPAPAAAAPAPDASAPPAS
jgi:predicted  nucleic acid-binding Zn-ribbon protein